VYIVNGTTYSLQAQQGIQSHLLQCGQILEDIAAKIMKLYFLTDSDPYKFDPGGVLADNIRAGVSSEAIITQLVALALRRCKHENKAELRHSPQYGIKDEKRGSLGQSEVKVQEGSSDREHVLSKQGCSNREKWEY
jgi:hypothetical protein